MACASLILTSSDDLLSFVRVEPRYLKASTSFSLWTVIKMSALTFLALLTSTLLFSVLPSNAERACPVDEPVGQFLQFVITVSR